MQQANGKCVGLAQIRQCPTPTAVVLYSSKQYSALSPTHLLPLLKLVRNNAHTESFVLASSNCFIFAPTSGVSNAYLRSKDDMRLLVESLEELDPVDKPITPAELSGRWELLYTTVELFRASPFFQMVGARRRVCERQRC